MNANCSYQDQIGELLFQDELAAERLSELRSHLEDCESCRRELAQLRKTVQNLGSMPAATPPRHFFVYDEPKRGWWRTGTFWRGAMAASLLLFLVAAGAVAGGLEVRREQGAVTLAFGDPGPDTQVLMDEVRNQLSADFEARLQQQRESWLEEIRLELNQAVSGLEEREKQNLKTALARLEGRLLAESDAKLINLRSDLQQTSLELAELAQQNRRAYEILNQRFDLIAVRDEIQGSRNQVLVSTLLQIADQRLREMEGS